MCAARIISDTSDHAKHIWDERGNLVPLSQKPSAHYEADVAAVIVNRNRPDLVASMVEQLQQMGQHLKMDIYVIEMGSDKDKLSRHCSLHYDDPDFRGKCYGHNVGLRLARSKGNYRYYWALMNDMVFEENLDTIQELVQIADNNPRLAILSPSTPNHNHPGCKPIPGSIFHLVSTCDYMALLIRAEAVAEVGFLNPKFKYSWGAIHELAYKLYSAGWQVAYCDKVTMEHLGGTTYGKAKDTISREKYLRKAQEFASRYFAENYGNKWDEDFAKALPPEVEHNTFKIHRDYWENSIGIRKQSAQHAKQEGICSLPRRIFSKLKNFSTKNSLLEEIEALHPWYYEIEIGDIKVTPGIGSKQTADELRSRVKYRTKLLVDEVRKRYDFSEKRMLDIASNCGYWPARYAELGAASLLAVEGRADYVQQGWLYWQNNNFLEPGSYEFIQGNVMEDETWCKIRERAPFDLTICCGILYHIPDYTELLRNIADVTNEAIIIDTRVSDCEKTVEEPGGWCFDAIVETRIKKTPSLKNLTDLMTKLGFQTERLTINDPVPEELKGNDDYSQNKREALLAIHS